MKTFARKTTAGLLALCAAWGLGSTWMFEPASANVEAADVRILEFKFLEKEFDKIGVSDTKPDGARDGHISLVFEAPQDTEIESMIVRTAGEDGKVNYHGTWKTQKEGTGWLLGVYRDGKPLSSTFKPTLGKYKGTVRLDLFLNDNNSIKPGELFYLEIETAKGTVTSPLIEFDTSPNRTSIRTEQFQLADKSSDKAGPAEFKKDGNKDGHFQLKLNVAQKTDIQAIIVRTTDEFGVFNHQGVWRTNRIGAGWLLGVLQDGKTLTPKFTDKLGTFQGNVTFDLYASDNGVMKSGMHYVFEIETPQGTLFSKPITMDEPYKGIRAVGGEGTLKVEYAVPLSQIAVIQQSGANEKNFGTWTADEKGSLTISSLPPGDYYVTETVDRKTDRITPAAKVTGGSFGGTFLTAETNGIQDDNKNMITLHIRGDLAKSAFRSREDMTVTIGGETKVVDYLRDDTYKVFRNYAIDEIPETFTLTVKTKEGMQSITRRVDNDLVVDSSLAVNKTDNGWEVFGMWTDPFDSATGKNYAGFVGAVTTNGERKKFDITGGAAATYFRIQIATDEDISNLALIAVRPGDNKFEIVHLRP